MDHREVREILEDAAIEPEGLERLMAGDTPTASIVAGHLAGCADCAEELERLRRSVGVIRPTVRAVPSPELRERTLAYVAAVGRPRGSSIAAASMAGGAPSPAVPVAIPVAADRTPDRLPDAGVPEMTAPRPDAPHALEPTPIRRAGSPRGSRLGWFASLAAAVAVAVTGTALLVNATHEGTTQTLSAEIDALGDVTRWTLRVDSQPDVRRIQLASTSGTQTNGSLLYSPSSTDLVMVADALTPAVSGHEYRCWVEAGGRRTTIGRMFFGGNLAYWVGKAPAVAGLGPDARFGVSLVDLGSAGTPGDPVLTSD